MFEAQKGKVRAQLGRSGLDRLSSTFAGCHLKQVALLSCQSSAAPFLDTFAIQKIRSDGITAQ